MASELFPEDSRTAACPSKRAHADTHSGSAVAVSPTKRQKKDVVGEKPVEDEMRQRGTANSHDKSFVEEEGDLGAKEAESLKAKDGQCLDGSGSDDSGDPALGLGLSSIFREGLDNDLEMRKKIQKIGLPSSVRQRQDDDPELKKKIHKVETDYWADRISRDVYNSERFELFTEEEREEARIVWPSRQMQSPAGYRDQMLECWSLRNDGPSLEDDVYKFGVPLPLDDEDGEVGDGGDEEAAKKRLQDKIEAEFEDPEARRAEIERWEKIREVEYQYYDERISRMEYNEQRIALYTEAERKEKCVIWSNSESVDCYSPAGFREAIFRQCPREVPDQQTRMAFHYPCVPLHGDDDSDEESFCKPCGHEHAAYLVDSEEQRAKQEVARQKEAATRLSLLERAAKKREERTIPCAACKKMFATETALTQYTAARHRGL